MIECYYHWCRYHNKDEPFCSEDGCKATDEMIKVFELERHEEMHRWNEDGRPLVNT